MPSSGEVKLEQQKQRRRKRALEKEAATEATEPTVAVKRRAQQPSGVESLLTEMRAREVEYRKRVEAPPTVLDGPRAGWDTRVPPPWNPESCVRWRDSGTCKFGDRCCFVHGVLPDRLNAPAESCLGYDERRQGFEVWSDYILPRFEPTARPTLYSAEARLRQLGLVDGSMLMTECEGRRTEESLRRRRFSL